MGSPAIPNTTFAIAFGKVYAAYVTNSYPPAGGTNIRLSATLGPYETVPPDPADTDGAAIKFSATFGGNTNAPYGYPT